MRRVVLAFLTVLCLSNLSLFGQSEEKATQKPDEIVQEWFRRLNAMDGSEESIKRFLDLYRPDALQQVGPSANQFGRVFYQDREQIQKWAEAFSKSHVPIPEAAYFAITLQTVNEKTAELFHTVQAPWGDIGVSVEFTGRYIDVKTAKGFMVSGAAFFQLREGKISRLRLYMPSEEIMEITPPLRP